MNNKNQKLWGGRFSQETPEMMDAFNASVRFDYRLYPYDIQGSLAHVKMLAHCAIVKKSEANKISRALKEIQTEIEQNNFTWELSKEDVHLNIESRLIEKVGPVGGKLHTARSRNDQVALDFRLYCRDQVEQLLKLLTIFQKKLGKLAAKYIDALLPGYTHLQRAQPVSLAHHLLAYVEMSLRDSQRLAELYARINILPLGSGAISGTTFEIDRKFVAQELGFSALTHNSMDAVSDRDFAIELTSHLSILMMHLSRLAEEWILWSSQEFAFIRLPQEYCTGSSMMPQKINPDALELVRGKTGRVYGDLTTLLTLMKSLPLTYNKDMQEDKEPVFDAVDTVSQVLEIMNAIITKTDFDRDRMYQANQEGFVLATEVADYLSERGLPFRQAHRVVGELVAYCQSEKKLLEELDLSELEKFSPLFEKSVIKILSVEAAVDRRTCVGGTSRKNIRKEIKQLDGRILKANKIKKK